MAHVEWSGPSPWADRERLAEQRARLPEPVYRALLLNEWIEAEGAFLDAEAIRRAFVLPGPSEPEPGRTYVATLDLGVTNDASVLAVGSRRYPAIHLDFLARWKGTKRNPVDLGEVRDAILHARDRYGFSRLAFDRWQAIRLAEELEARGLACEPFTFTAASKQRMSGVLLQVINEGSLRLFEPGGLEAELRALTIRTTGAGWSFDHSRCGHDDMATAISMLALDLLTEAPSTAGSISTLPIPDSRRTIARAGIHLSGVQYLDLVPGQRERVPPPGWTETTPTRRNR